MLNEAERCPQTEELEAAKRQAQAAADRLEMALSIANACVWEFRLLERRVIGGEALAKLFGKPITWDDIRRPDSTIFPQDELKKLASILDGAKEGAKHFDVEHKYIRSNGETRWMKTQAESLTNDEGVVDCLLMHTADITERKLLEFELHRAFRTASESLRARRDLIQTIKQDIAGSGSGHEALIPSIDLSAPEAGASLPDLMNSLQGILAEIELRDAMLAAAVSKLRAARAAADAASVAKTRFLTTVTHELRTPLNAIINFSEIVSEDLTTLGASGPLDDVARIRASGHHLLTLVENVLDFAGETSLEQFERVDVSEFVRAVVEPYRLRAQSKGMEFVLEVATDSGVVLTSPASLTKALRALLDNACKFTTQGAIHFRVGRQMIASRDAIIFEVADTGIGMAPAQTAGLFQPFGQCDASTTRKFEGVGLGLAIAHKKITALGGSISAESNPGAGTTFRVILPAPPYSNAAESDRAS